MSPDDKSGSVWAVAIIFLILSWLTVALRVYVRVEQIAKFGLDDKLVVFAQIFYTGYLVCQMGGAAYGTGRHLSDLDYASAETALRFWFFCEVWYALATTCVKIAICLSLRRVVVKWLHMLVIYGLMVWSVALGLAFLLGIIFQCTPTSDWWDLDPDHKHCLAAHTITSLTYAVSALNVACDWTLGIFPFFIVKDLEIPLYQKVMVASILAFGALGSTATVVRMAYIPALEQTYLGWDGDFLYDTTPVAIWSTVEIGVGITAICLATLRPLIKRAFRFMRSSNQTSYRHGYPSTRMSEDSHAPIPLVDSQSGSMMGPSSSRTFSNSQNDFAGITHFNTTKAIRSYHRETDDDYRVRIPPEIYPNATRSNPTRPLSSSSIELEDEYYQSRSPIRRHGVT